jgi:hypothetical protein
MILNGENGTVKIFSHVKDVYESYRFYKNQTFKKNFTPTIYKSKLEFNKTYLLLKEELDSHFLDYSSPSDLIADASQIKSNYECFVNSIENISKNLKLQNLPKIKKMQLKFSFNHPLEISFLQERVEQFMDLDKVKQIKYMMPTYKGIRFCKDKVKEFEITLEL